MQPQTSTVLHKYSSCSERGARACQAPSTLCQVPSEQREAAPGRITLMFITLCRTVLSVSLQGCLVSLAFGGWTVVVVSSLHHFSCYKNMHVA